jgi:hypothetical protein
MHNERKFALLAVAFLATTALLANETLAGGMHGDKMHDTGKGCGQLVTLKHPDLKGAGRKKEWDKCMSDPGAYNQ